jgi:hypothetical protein
MPTPVTRSTRCADEQGQTTPNDDSAPRAQSAELEAALTSLRDEVAALRVELRGAGAVRLPAAETAGWDEPAPASAQDPGARAWVSAVGPPTERRASIPRWLPELAFIVAVAVTVAVAELDPLVIVGVMAAAWAIVAIVELALALAEPRVEIAQWTPAPPAPNAPADPSWFSPPVEHTLLDGERPPDADTAITRLPAAAETTRHK